MREEIYDFEKGKVHKLELYVFDPNNTYDDAMSIFNEIYNKLYDGVPTTEVYWYDNIDINLSREMILKNILKNNNKKER